MVKLGVAFGTVLILIIIAGWIGFSTVGQVGRPPVNGLEIALDPVTWPNSGGLTFSVIGDYGTGGTNQLQVARQMAATYQKQPFSLFLTVGDNVYSGEVAERATEVIYKPYKALFDAGVEFRPSLGNHDIEDPGDLSTTIAALGMPGRYYHFTAGQVDFFALDSNRMDDNQLAWLRTRLSCSDVLWQVVYMHHPLYSAGTHGSDDDLRETLEPVLILGGADIVFSGHDHDYERSTPQHGIVHVVTGGGGANIRRVGSIESTAVSKAVLHFLLAKVSGSSMEIQAINDDRAVVDSFSIEPRQGLAPCREG